MKMLAYFVQHESCTPRLKLSKSKVTVLSCQSATVALKIKPMGITKLHSSRVLSIDTPLCVA